jgi:hypothetical protein
MRALIRRADHDLNLLIGQFGESNLNDDPPGAGGSWGVLNNIGGKVVNHGAAYKSAPKVNITPPLWENAQSVQFWEAESNEYEGYNVNSCDSKKRPKETQ